MKKWIDENGLEIPNNRVTYTERLMERSANKIVKNAIVVNKRLSELKRFVEDTSMKIYLTIMSEKGIDVSKRKGNYTWYNFNKTVKIEIDANYNIQFDEILLEACRTKLFQFLEESITSEVTFVKQIIKDAFTRRDGRLDPKQILGLLRYKNKVINPLYHEAMDILEESYRRVRSKQYSRVWVKKENSEWENVELNYSSIVVEG